MTPATIGDACPKVTLRDASDNALDLASVGRRALLVMYEDRASSTHNQTFKDELARTLTGRNYTEAIVIVPVADVQSYNYWPVRNLVKDAIREQSQAAGITIYCDWDGEFRRALGLQRETSTVVLYDTNARVAFVHVGVMDAHARARAIALIESNMNTPDNLIQRKR